MSIAVLLYIGFLALLAIGLVWDLKSDDHDLEIRIKR